MKLVRAFVYVALFCVNVHVRAEETAKSTETGCWGKSIPCAVHALGGRKTLEADGMKLSMSDGSILEERDGDVIQLVQGAFYADVTRPVKFGTPFGKIWCESECAALFERESSRVLVKALKGRWSIVRTGENKTYALAPGLQILLAEVELDGKAQMEFPQSLPWLSTVKQWAALYPGTAKQLKPQLEEFRDIWHEAVEAVSHLHENTAHREVAAYNQEQAEELARQKAREKEDESLRGLFRQKNYINP